MTRATLCPRNEDSTPMQPQSPSSSAMPFAPAAPVTSVDAASGTGTGTGIGTGASADVWGGAPRRASSIPAGSAPAWSCRTACVPIPATTRSSPRPSRCRMWIRPRSPGSIPRSVVCRRWRKTTRTGRGWTHSRPRPLPGGDALPAPRVRPGLQGRPWGREIPWRGTCPWALACPWYRGLQCHRSLPVSWVTIPAGSHPGAPVAWCLGLRPPAMMPVPA